MTDYQTYISHRDTVEMNAFRMYGYAQGTIKHLARELSSRNMKTEDVARELVALEKTMQRLFEERGEIGAADRINDYLNEFRKETKAD